MRTCFDEPMEELHETSKVSLAGPLGLVAAHENGAPAVGHEFARTGRDHASGVGKWGTGQRQESGAFFLSERMKTGGGNEAMQAAAGQVGERLSFFWGLRRRACQSLP
jgi:hypothetical protein